MGCSIFPKIFESIITSTNCKADSGPTLELSWIRNVSNLYIPCLSTFLISKFYKTCFLSSLHILREATLVNLELNVKAALDTKLHSTK